jgi:tetratricopeptide (TPR) repeat protein
MNRTGTILATILGFSAVVVVFTALLVIPTFFRTVEKGSAAYAQGDYAAALDILRPLAEDGEPTAEFYVGEMYRFGRGVKKDEAKAAAWYKKSAVQGSSDAQYALGMMYAFGIGVDADYVEAYRWLSLADLRLSPWETERRDKAVKTREKLLKIMPQADVDRAKALVIAWDRKWQK